MEFDQIAILADQTFIIYPVNSDQVVMFGEERIPTTAGVPVVVHGTGPVLISKGSAWSRRAVFAGNYTGPYFDGSTQSTDTSIFFWNGPVNASTSTMRRLGNNSGANKFIIGGGTSGMKFVPNTFNRVGYSAVVGKGLESAGVQLKEVGSWLN